MSPAAYWLYREKPLLFLRLWLVAAKISFLLSPPFLRFRSSSLFSWGKARALLVGRGKDRAGVVAAFELGWGRSARVSCGRWVSRRAPLWQVTKSEERRVEARASALGSLAGAGTRRGDGRRIGRSVWMMGWWDVGEGFFVPGCKTVFPSIRRGRIFLWVELCGRNAKNPA